MQLSVSLNYRIVILVVLLLPILLGLGNWQLRREAEKKEIQTSFQARQQQAPVSFSELKALTDLAFMPVRLQGQFDHEAVFLLDNRINQGQVGYEVLVPFHLDTGDADWLLVNRGWIKAPALRSDLPELPALPTGSVELLAEVYVPPSQGYQLASIDDENASWPMLVTVVDIESMSERFGRKLFGYQLRLKPGQPSALSIDWAPINVSPEKHRAYAVQWFAMAIGLVLWLVFASISVRKPSASDS